MRIGKFVDQQSSLFGDEGINICGVLLYAQPQRLDEVAVALSAMDGVEIHQKHDDGRMILTVEDTEAEWAGQIITRMAAMSGVLSTSLIYHHCEPGNLEEEFCP